MKRLIARLAVPVLMIMGLSAVSSCSIDLGESMLDGGFEKSTAPDGASGQGNGSAGVVTAGEWNDLNHWNFWGRLISDNSFSNMPDYWGFYTNYRIAVKVIGENGEPVSRAKVELYTDKTGRPEWETFTDNRGFADCWLGLYSKDLGSKPEELHVKVNGILQKGSPVVTSLPIEVSAKEQEKPTADSCYNVYKIKSLAADKKKADIAFIVDATGSMGDEIAFLKEDLMDIIKKSSSQADVPLRTAALFYRDTEDEYVTRFSNFTENPENTLKFVAAQDAGGGGDYPEAVHTALETALQKLSWNENASSKIAFMLLDAPAHHNNEVIESLHQTIRAYAKNGIILIPIAASGADKNTEFMLRFFAISTGGTYVFITNDSGIGGYHIEPNVGKFNVEQLNELIIRLIKYYTETPVPEAANL